MHQGVVFNIQRCSIHDGPGLRTTVFLKGCPLACSWCHNPEGRAPGVEMVVIESRCIACGICLTACPQEVARPVERVGRHPAEIEMCTTCGFCADVCPTEARQMAGNEMTVAEVLAELLRDRPFYDESGGGVTFSGGEPLQQAAFLRHLLAACRAERLHTAVDTCGLAPRAELLAVAELADLILFDLKLVDDARHRRWTGVGNAAILDNLRALGHADTAVWVRVPVIPGVNDDHDNLSRVARLAAELPAVAKLCLIPYHTLGKDKLRRLGQDEQRALAGVEPPTPKQMADLAILVEAAGVAAQIGG